MVTIADATFEIIAACGQLALAAGDFVDVRVRRTDDDGGEIQFFNLTLKIDRIDTE